MKSWVLLSALAVAVVGLGGTMFLQPEVSDDCLNEPQPPLCFTMKAHHQAMSGDIEGALNYARETIAPYSRNTVHVAMHMIGHAAYDLLQSRADAMALLPEDAFNESNRLIFEGFQHGVLQSYFSAKKHETKMEMLIKESCNPYYVQHNNETDTFWGEGRQCFHAAGHGLMAALDNDIEKSIAVCKQLPYDWMTERCAYGAFMELSYLYAPNYLPHGSKENVTGDDMSQLCGSTKDLEEICSRFVGRSYFASHPNDYEGTFKSCEKLDTQYQSVCRAEIAQFIVTGAGTNFEKAKYICSFALTNEKECLFSAATAIGAGLAGKAAQKKDFCSTLAPSIQSECQSYKGTRQ